MNDVTLREYMEKQLEYLERAVIKSEQQLNKRLEGMNEFRDTLKDQAATFVTVIRSNRNTLCTIPT